MNTTNQFFTRAFGNIQPAVGKAEKYIKFVSMMNSISTEHLETIGGAVKLFEVKGGTFSSLGFYAPLNGAECEPGPGNEKDTTNCVFMLYQFPDQSLIWYVHAPDKDYLKLQPSYGSGFKNVEYVDVEYVAAGETLPSFETKPYSALGEMITQPDSQVELKTPQSLSETGLKKNNLKKTNSEKASNQKTVTVYPEIWNKPVEEIGLPTRTVNVLRNADIFSVGQLISRDENGLLSIKDFAAGHMKHVKQALSKLKLNLNTDVGNWLQRIIGN